ncbi:hypothetical protein DPMN_134012 [Dreissena polymorpha]|uniref:Uncharacterized protein n=1 Tax=Dreissena polymorpha TaxID=45954 RepID=A0A9D4FVE9_DREPO|nr:hypothetical protein DPMN_134012 [Dreissena polymorpha]
MSTYETVLTCVKLPGPLMRQCMLVKSNLVNVKDSAGWCEVTLSTHETVQAV